MSLCEVLSCILTALSPASQPSEGEVSVTLLPGPEEGQVQGPGACE